MIVYLQVLDSLVGVLISLSLADGLADFASRAINETRQFELVDDGDHRAHLTLFWSM